MKFRWPGVVAGTVLLLASGAWAGKPDDPGGGHGGPRSCDEAAVAAAAAAIAVVCPCEGRTDDAGDVVPWANHGKYVRCVARATKRVVRGAEGGLSRRCLKSSVRCAARSTCGRAAGVVNCTTTSSSACIDAACADGSTCTTSADCSASSCSFRASAEECTAEGGVPGTGSCCDPSPVGSPSGAFVDPTAFF